MNPDNPYVAPQTIGLPQLTASMPVAGAQGNPLRRQRLAEWDTARLKTFWKRSRAINDMQVVWFLACIVVPFCGYFFALSFGLYAFSFDPTRGWIAFGGVVLTFARFGLGFVRSRLMRLFAIVVDGLLCLGCVAVIVWCVRGVISEPGDVIPASFVVFITTLIGLPTVLCLRAILLAPELFGPHRISHDELAEEVEHRKVQPLDQAKTP